MTGAPRPKVPTVVLGRIGRHNHPLEVRVEDRFEGAAVVVRCTNERCGAATKYLQTAHRSVAALRGEPEPGAWCLCAIAPSHRRAEHDAARARHEARGGVWP